MVNDVKELERRSGSCGCGFIPRGRVLEEGTEAADSTLVSTLARNQLGNLISFDSRRFSGTGVGVPGPDWGRLKPNTGEC